MAAFPIINFSIPDISDEVVARDMLMREAWYRYFELFEQKTALISGYVEGTIAPILATEDLTERSLVNVWNNTGAEVRLADATAAGKEAHGYILADAAAGAMAQVFFFGAIVGLTGLTPGAAYLGVVPGAVTSTPPSASGNIIQQVGIIISSSLIFAPQPSVELA